MKKIHIALTAMLFSAAFYSCKKNDVVNFDQPLTESTTQIKYYNFGVNAPNVNYFANDIKVTGTVSATGAETATGGITSGGVYPTSNYSVLSSNTYAIKAQIPTVAATNPGVVINTLNAKVESNKFYSYYTCGIYNTTDKTADAFITEDQLPAIDYNTAYVRFVNTVSNATAGFNLYARNTLIPNSADILVATNVAYKGASSFVAIPTGTYELYARYAATPTVNTIPRNATLGGGTVAFANGKVYTISSRGDMAVPTTGTATNRPLLDNTANR
jgi:hypothetical protein